MREAGKAQAAMQAAAGGQASRRRQAHSWASRARNEDIPAPLMAPNAGAFFFIAARCSSC